MVPPPSGYLQAARDACDAAGALLVADEIQSGIGRTGSWFAYQQDGVTPDVLTLAKGLGGGLPIGACIGLGDAGTALRKGDHGSTFGGNPVACAAALAVLDTIEADGLLEHAAAVGRQLADGLAQVSHPLLRGVRGRGLWLAAVLTQPLAAQAEAAAREAGFLVNAVQPDAVRLAPALILRHDQAAAFLDAWPAILDALPFQAAQSPPGRGPDMPRHFLRDDDLSPAEQAEVLDLAAAMKADRFGYRPLAGPRTVAVLFDKPSTRTRISFSVGIAELGGHPAADRRADLTARARRADRRHGPGAEQAGGRDRVADLRPGPGQPRWRRPARVPVINGLTDAFHPCQVLADLQTVREAHGPLAGLTLTFLGDGSSNMAHSYLLGGATAGMRVRIAAPEEYRPDPAVLADAQAIAARTGGAIEVTGAAKAACADADVLATDVWTSMGQEGQEAARSARLRPYQLDEEKLGLAGPGCVVPALPARAPRRGDHRGGASTGRAAWSGTRRKTGCTRRRRCWPGCWSGPDDVREPGHQDRAAGPDRRHPGPDRGPVPGGAGRAAGRARGTRRPDHPVPRPGRARRGPAARRRRGARLRAARRAGRPRLAARRAGRGPGQPVRPPRRGGPAGAAPGGLAAADRDPPGRLARIAAEFLLSAEASANLVVLRTPAGAAQFLASAIDHAAWSSILGTVAGDDTVLVISRDPAAAPRWPRPCCASRSGGARPGRTAMTRAVLADPGGRTRPGHVAQSMATGFVELWGLPGEMRPGGRRGRGLRAPPAEAAVRLRPRPG